MRWPKTRATLCEDAGVEIELSEINCGEVTFDTILLRQVILNLLNNALNVTLAGGRIALSSSVNHDRWRVAFQGDDGPGLPASRLADVFEPFVRVSHDGDYEKRNGAGLGLAICRRILDLHHGSIYAGNRTPGPGLRVIFEMAYQPSRRRTPKYRRR